MIGSDHKTAQLCIVYSFPNSSLSNVRSCIIQRTTEKHHFRERRIKKRILRRGWSVGQCPLLFVMPISKIFAFNGGPRNPILLIHCNQYLQGAPTEFFLILSPYHFLLVTNARFNFFARILCVLQLTHEIPSSQAANCIRKLFLSSTSPFTLVLDIYIYVIHKYRTGRMGIHYERGNTLQPQL
jgi:hypothetical protein